MNLKGFLDSALTQALELGMAAPADVLKHTTPELLSVHLPRPLWARLLTACLGAPRVDAQLVIETVGIANLCEHLPVAVMWNCLSEIATRSLGREFVPLPVSTSSVTAPANPPPAAVTREPSGSRPPPLSLTPPPEEKPREPAPPKPVALGPSIPSPSTADSLADVVAALEADAGGATFTPPPSRARTPTSQRFRQSNTGIGRLAANNTRRPQASAPVEQPIPPRSQRRGSTEVTDIEVEAEGAGAKNDDAWKNAIAVEDDQLEDWVGVGEETQNSDDYTRKR